MQNPAPKIVVTGATGGLGSIVVRELLRLLGPFDIGVSTRHPEAVGYLAARGIRVRHGDFDDPSTLDAAFEGADCLLLISTRAASNEHRLIQQRNAVDAARRVGVGKVFYTSVLQRRGSAFRATAGHADTEDYLARSGQEHVIIRNGHYTENLPLLLADSLQTGEAALPPDGPTSWVARADLGEGIARLLARRLDGNREVCLTGPEALDFEQIVEILGRVAGRRVVRRVIDPAMFVEQLMAKGMALGTAELLASGFASRAAGELSLVDPTLREILGRPLRTVESVLARLLLNRLA